ncbi:MAG: FtsX-like permease family protein [Xanthomonadales bacterium]|nr:FtsX-like permease family protein [Xanthomonadales bacterium]
MPVLHALIEHYRRHPLQALFLLVGIVIANVLLVGTQLINAQARASYDEGERWLGAQPVASLLAADGSALFDERAYFELRRAGFSQLAPVLNRVVTSASGERLELTGFDLYALPRNEGPDSGDVPDFGAFTRPPYRTWAAPTRLGQLGIAAEESLALNNGRSLPPAEPLEDAGLGHRLVVDIGVLQELTGTRGQLSEIWVFAAADDRQAALQAALPAELTWQASDAGLDANQMTRSLHLNLAAMGLLAFVVGVFLTYNAVSFSLEERGELFRRLKLSGVTQRELYRALLIELAVFTAVGVTLGYVLGARLALGLLPEFGASLAALYDVYIAYPDRIVAGGAALPLAMTGIAVALSVAGALRRAVNTPLLTRQRSGWADQTVAHRDRRLLLAGLAMLGLAVGLSAWALHIHPRLWVALAGMAAVLLGAALCLPAVLRGLLQFISSRVSPNHPLVGWAVSDARWLLGPAAVALMALTLALTANSGLNTMISSFRDATDRWLDQRLAAEIYVTGEVDAAELSAWLASTYSEVRWVARYARGVERAAPNHEPVPVSIASVPPEADFIDGIGVFRSDALSEANQAFANGEGIYVSERAGRLDGWRIGNQVLVCDGVAPLPILGIYRDYGSPVAEWAVAEPLFRECWPGASPDGFGLYAETAVDWAAVQSGMRDRFGLPARQVIDQRGLRDAALAVFDRTFVVTRALNALTLLVAAIGIFCAVSAIHHHRLHHQAVLATLGVTRAERLGLQLVVWGGLGLLCLAVVLPFGALLAWVLSSVVTPVAFGWSFGLQYDVTHLPALFLLAGLSLLLAVLWPSWRLMRTAPAAMLREGAT